MLVLLRCAVGRSCELATSTWSSAEYDIDGEALIFDWREVKTGKETAMVFTPDAKGWLIDPIHSLAAYLVTNNRGSDVGDPSTKNADWIFPSLAGLSSGGSIATYCTNIMRECVGKVNGVLKEHTIHTIRAGSADDMCEDPTLGVVPMVARGGWSLHKETNLMFYVTKRIHCKYAGKVLGGHKDIRGTVYLPSLEFIDSATVAEKSSLIGLVNLLFTHVTSKEFEKNGRMYEFRNIFVASLLEHLEAFEIDIGNEDNMLSQVLLYNAAKVDLNKKRLLQFGKEVCTILF